VYIDINHRHISLDGKLAIPHHQYAVLTPQMASSISGTHVSVRIHVADLSSTDPIEFLLETQVGITWIMPKDGPTVGGTYITISGYNLDVVDVLKHHLQIGSTTAVGLEVLSAHQMVARTTEGSGRLLDVGLDVVVGQPSVESLADSRVHFNYEPPLIHRLRPPRNNLGAGDTLTIIGQNFGPRDGQRLIALYATVVESCDSTRWLSHTTLHCIMPSSLPRLTQVMVEINKQRSYATIMPPTIRIGQKLLEQNIEPSYNDCYRLRYDACVKCYNKHCLHWLLVSAADTFANQREALDSPKCLSAALHQCQLNSDSFN